MLIMLLWAWAETPRYFAYTNKVVVVFGGSSGIGKSIGSEALRRGARVVLLSRKMDVLESAREDILRENKLTGEDKKRVFVVSCDATDEKACEEAARKIKAEMGGADMLVYSAGISEPAKLTDLPAGKFHQVLDVNVFGARNSVVAMLPMLRDSGLDNDEGARVVLVGSTLSLMGLYGLAAYCASKLGVFGFAQSLHQELLPFNIRVSMCMPADTDTPLLERENQTKPRLTKEISGNAAIMPPQEVAAATLDGASHGMFLVSSEFVTWLISLTAAGMCPAPTLYEKIPQVFLASFVRMIALWFQYSWDSILLAERAKIRERRARGQGDDTPLPDADMLGNIDEGGASSAKAEDQDVSVVPGKKES